MTPDSPLVAVLVTGFLLGLRHALDADHLTAVATLVGRGGIGRSARAGLSWGLGHALAIGAVGGLLIMLRVTLPERLALLFELLVGVMLVVLGVIAIADSLAGRLHAHEHRHGAVVHSHLHFHRVPHESEARDHRHPHPLRVALRPFLVGTLHGLAGSGAMVLLILTTLPTILAGCIYLGLFGAGSAAGMTLMSLVLAAPLALARRRAAPVYRALRATAGFASLTVGIFLVWEIGVGRGLFL